MKLSELLARRHHGNPKEHDVDGLVASIKRWGFTAPPTLDATSGVLVAGHGRLDALMRIKTAGEPPPKRIEADDEGDWVVPAFELAFADDEERDAYVIADNKLTEAGGWGDGRKLAEMMRKFTRLDLRSMGYTAQSYRDAIAKWKPDGTAVLDQEQLEAIDTGVRLYDADAIADAAFKHYREHGFPYPDVTLPEAYMQLNRLAAMSPKALINTIVGYSIADKFQPHRFAASAEAKRAPLDAFKDDRLLRIAIEQLVRQERDPGVTPGALRGMISLVRNTQGCANFRPGFAAYLYRRYCPTGGVVLDTSTGYGGRLVGALASTVVKHYVGIDPNRVTCAGNRDLLTWLDREHFATIIESPAEDVGCSSAHGASDTHCNVPPESCDFSFTSPPYFRKEHYSDDDTQSWKRWPEAESWRRGFLEPMLRLTHDALKPRATAIVNIADVLVGGERHPLGQWTIDAALAAGLSLVDRLEFPMTRRYGANQSEDVATEPVLVFRKP